MAVSPGLFGVDDFRFPDTGFFEADDDFAWPVDGGTAVPLCADVDVFPLLTADVEVEVC